MGCFLFVKTKISNSHAYLNARNWNLGVRAYKGKKIMLIIKADKIWQVN